MSVVVAKLASGERHQVLNNLNQKFIPTLKFHACLIWDQKFTNPNV